MVQQEPAVVHDVTCACCGVTWTPSTANQMVSQMAMGAGGAAPVLRDFHKKCYEFVAAQVKFSTDQAVEKLWAKLPVEIQQSLAAEWFYSRGGTPVKVPAPPTTPTTPKK